MSLFKVAPSQEHLFPKSFAKASRLATRILRSEHHNKLLTELWAGETSPTHINPDELSSVLSKSEIFTCDKIRDLDFAHAMACTQRETDPFKVYFQPMLLLEMQDREREAEQLFARPVNQWPSLLDKLEFFKEILTETSGQTSAEDAGEFGRRLPGTSKELNIDHDHVDLNSLVYIAQAKQRLLDKARAKEDKQRNVKEKEERVQAEATAAPATTANLRSKGEKRGVPDSAGPTKKLPKLVNEPAPSTMTVEQKHVLLLTILLVHETQHLLMYGLSDALVNGNTPKIKYRGDDPDYFSDVGHYMERALYGYSINHAFNHHFMTPFGVDEVIGGLLQSSKLEYVLQPSPQFLSLLNNLDCKRDIEEEDLKLKTTGEQEYTPPRKTVRLVLAPEVVRTLHASTSSGSSDSSQEAQEKEDDEDDELQRMYPAPTITQGKA